MVGKSMPTTPTLPLIRPPITLALTENYLDIFVKVNKKQKKIFLWVVFLLFAKSFHVHSKYYIY